MTLSNHIARGTMSARSLWTSPARTSSTASTSVTYPFIYKIMLNLKLDYWLISKHNPCQSHVHHLSSRMRSILSQRKPKFVCLKSAHYGPKYNCHVFQELWFVFILVIPLCYLFLNYTALSRVSVKHKWRWRKLPQLALICLPMTLTNIYIQHLFHANIWYCYK